MGIGLACGRVNLNLWINPKQRPNHGIADLNVRVMGSPKPVAASGNTWTYMGNKPSEVASMWPNWDYKTYTVEDLAIGQIRFENGALLHIEASFAAHIEKDVWNFNLMGEKGGANWDPGIYQRFPGIFVFGQRAGRAALRHPG